MAHKVTSNVTVDFPKLKWGIHAGEVRELPEDKDAQAQILATPGISDAKDAPKSGSDEKNLDTK